VAPTTDPLADAITVLENVRIEMPSARPDTEDAHNRVNLALEYLRLERDWRRKPEKQACESHLLDGHTWTCPACLVAEAERRERVSRAIS
jgi:hypothetical protein